LPAATAICPCPSHSQARLWPRNRRVSGECRFSHALIGLVSYSGPSPGQPVYRCERPRQMLGLPRCLTFGGLRVDAAIAGELFRVVDPMANGAAMEAEQRYWRESGVLPVSMHISARLSGRSRSRDLTLPEWFAAFTATTGAALRQVRLHHPIPAPGPVSISRWQARSSPILDTAF
jgi:hypothetical protein